MAHQWQAAPKTMAEFLHGAKRECSRCGAVQYRDLVAYDRIQGSRYGWQPPAGRCRMDNRSHTDKAGG